MKQIKKFLLAATFLLGLPTLAHAAACTLATTQTGGTTVTLQGELLGSNCVIYSIPYGNGADLFTPSNPGDMQGVTGGVPMPVQSGGYTAATSLAPAVTASAYSAGYSIGGLLTFSGLVRSTQATALIQKVVASFADTQTPTLDLILFNASPTSSTTTDHAAFSLAGADIAKVLGVIHVTDCSAAGTPTVCQAQQQAVPIVLPSNGASLYAVLVTRAAITPASTSDLTVLLGSLED